MTKKNRPIPSTNEIKLYFHCKHCLKDLPVGMSPQQWVSIEAGWTELGFQVWCRRCDMNIVHVDFEGQKHPANTTGRDTVDPKVVPFERGH